MLRQQGKAAPMAASKGARAGGGFGLGIGSGGAMLSAASNGRSNWRNANSFLDDHDRLFGSIGTQKTKDRVGYNDDDVFGGLPKYASVAADRNAVHSGSYFNYDSIFKESSEKSSSLPVFDKPVYDDGGSGGSFNGVTTAGLRSSALGKSSDVFSFDSSSKQGERYDDLLGKLGRMDPELKSSSTRKRLGQVPKRDDSYDELLGKFSKVEMESKSSRSSSSSSGRRSEEVDRDMSGFNDLIPGFGGRNPSNDRVPSGASHPRQSTVPSSKSTSSVIEDLFVVFESNSTASHTSSGQFIASVEEIDKPSKSGSTKVDVSSARGTYDNMDPFAGLTKSVPFVSSDMKNREKDRSPSRTTQNLTNLHKYTGRGSTDTPTGRMTESSSQKKTSVVDYHESHQSLFDIPTVSSDLHKSFSRNGSLPSHVNVNTNQSTSQVDVPPKSDDCSESSNEVWISVSEVPLFTQPTSTPPPSRPPPARPAKGPHPSKGSFSAANSKKVGEVSFFQNPSQRIQSPLTVPDSSRASGVSSKEELKNFAMGRSQSNAGLAGDISCEEGVDSNSAAASAAAMKDAMARAEAKFKYAREVREREFLKGARTRGAAQGKDEKVMQDARERELKEDQERIDCEREHREREEKEREQRRQLEIEREREKARQAVERATREARERAAAEALLKAARAAAEKANAARERAEWAVVQRAQAEARERAAVETKERAQRAAAEAREKAQAETREKAAAAAKAEAEERLREERAAAAARVNQQKNDADIESFFNMGARPSGAPTRTSLDPAFDVQFHNRPGPEGTHGSFNGTSSSIKNTSSTKIVDDLNSIFGASPSSGEFREVEGESEERRRARLMRHQKAEERAAKAIAEKNERDLQAQREQAERHRMAETLDIEIKRWAAGKEGNLRALLSSLQYVLWPEAGWQTVSLTDLITAASVKKVYRKATLCIHPDKVQQKGANLQQKYIAEKVFDLLKEGWNKFNSEELF